MSLFRLDFLSKKIATFVEASSKRLRRSNEYQKHLSHNHEILKIEHFLRHSKTYRIFAHNYGNQC